MRNPYSHDDLNGHDDHDDDRDQFDRERFLLKLFAVILFGEVAIYLLGVLGCAWVMWSGRHIAGAACSGYSDKISTAFDVALNTLLALLGGTALGESRRIKRFMQTRRPPQIESKPEDQQSSNR